MGDAKVAQAGRAVLGQEHVGGFQVAVDDAQVVGAGQGVGHFEHNCQDARDGQDLGRFGLASGVDPFAQRAAGYIFHHQVVLLIFFDGGDVLDDVGVVELAQGHALPPETLDQLSLAGAAFEHLDGDELIRLGIQGAVDGPHAAPSEQVSLWVGDGEAVGDGGGGHRADSIIIKKPER